MNKSKKQIQEKENYEDEYDEELEEVDEDEIEAEQELEEEIEENLHQKKQKDNKGNKMIDVAHMNVDMGEVNLKIQGLVDILSDFKNKKEEGKTRTDYMTELKQLLMIYYDYNEDIMNLILYLFPPNETVEFLESNNTQRVMTIRTNTLKTKRRELAKALIQRGVNLDPLAEWSKVGLKIYESQVPIGATPEYLAGHYMLQSGSSFLPVLALAPLENEKILDMAAAPGGKTTYIAQLMKNTGVLVANDLKKERLKSLYFNIHRLGIKNAIITNYDGRKIQKVFSSFDRVLLDAPCSGLGVISKDQSIKLNRTYKDIIQTTRIQKELLLAAIDCCSHKSKTGGIVVYSTCSISVEENEWVVDYALKNRYVKLLDTGFEIGEQGFVSFRDRRFHPSLKLTKRIYPHLHNMDGFFVAKLQKYAEGSKTLVKEGNKKKSNKNKKGKNQDHDQDQLKDENIIEEENDFENMDGGEADEERDLTPDEDNDEDEDILDEGREENYDEDKLFEEAMKKNNSKNEDEKYLNRKRKKDNKQKIENEKKQENLPNKKLKKK